MTRQRQIGHVINLWLVSMACLQSNVTTAVSPLEETLVHQVTCTHQLKSLILLMLLETQDFTPIVIYNKYSGVCFRYSQFSDCSPMADNISVKTVTMEVESGSSRVVTCVAEILHNQTFLNKTLGNVTITGPDTTSGWMETTHIPSTQTLKPGADKAGPSDETRDNHGNQTTSDTVLCVTRGQQETRDTSPMTVWMLGGVSAGLVLLAALAALLALMVRKEKRKSQSLMYRISMDLPMHNSCLPVHENSYLPSPPTCSSLNAKQTSPSPRLLARRRQLAVRRHLSPTHHDDIYLTPCTPHSCPLNPLTQECCPLTSDHYAEYNRCEEDRTWGDEAADRANLPENCSNDIDDENTYSSVQDLTVELGESVNCVYTERFI